MSPSPSRSPRLSVVIPSRDRPVQLAATLGALAEQRLRGGARGGARGEDFEVWVVDDGSTPPLRPPPDLDARLACHWLRQQGQGPAAARNRGIAAASGRRILLLGDDTRPAPGALQAHLQVAEQSGGEVAVQGMIDWDPEQPITPLMDFLAPSGPQFYFTALRDGGPVPYSAVLGSNYSAPRRWFVEEPFDEGFPAAALEDTELAYRFEQRGWRSVFARQALCWHDHHYGELQPFLERQRRAGRAARHAIRRHPGLAWRVALQPLLMAPWVLARRRCSADPLRRRQASWDAACRWAFVRGLLSRGV